MSAPQTIEFPFPFRGVNQSAGVAAQPEGTSPLAINVRGFDQIGLRDRGCQRAGYQKVINAINASGKPIDLIRSAMLGPASITGGFAYTYTAATMNGTGAGTHTTGSNAGASGYYYPSAYQVFKVGAGPHTINNTASPVSWSPAAFFTPGYAHFGGSTITCGATIALNNTSLDWRCILGWDASNYTMVKVTRTSMTVTLVSWRGTVTNTYSFADFGYFAGAAKNYFLTFSASSVILQVNGLSIISHVYTGDEAAVSLWQSAVSPIQTIAAGADPTGTTNLYDNISFTAAAAPPNFDPVGEDICYLQNGLIFTGDMNSGFTALGGPGYTTGVQVDMVAAYGYFWLVDGTLALRKVDAGGATVTTPGPTAGTIPTLARILALYRGRLFHAGFVSDPFNYFASRSGDVLDYDYSALDQAGAFAGNDTLQAGRLGDTITAMIPYGDVSMIMGMASSIAVMRGDPKAGGSIAFLSREVGIASIGAWARSPDGTLYFMARDGLYKISGEATNRLDLYGAVASATPQPMSRGRLDATLGKIDFTRTKVLMSWDPLELGVKIVLMPSDPTLPTTIVFWEQRKDAFWIDSVPVNVAPTAICPLRGSGGPGGILLIGSYDGWLRQQTAAALDDDGTAIVSRVRYAPMLPFGPETRAKLMQLRHLWGDATTSFNAAWSLFCADDPVTTAQMSLASLSGTVTEGGYQSLIRQRTRGACMLLEIGNSVPGTSWQIERVQGLVAPSGRVRA